MSEEILKALMQLFAIISKQDDGSTENQRAFVESFLASQLSNQKVQEYLKLYDEKSGSSNRDSLDMTHHTGKLTSVKDSVKTLAISRKINKTLTHKQKVIVLLRLFEMLMAEHLFTEQRMGIITTTATIFNIAKDELDLINGFISNDDPRTLNSKEILVVSSTWLGPDDHEREIIQILSYGLDSSISILRIKSADLYFVKYHGSSVIYLNGLSFDNRKVYLFPYGSTLRIPKGSIYYNDVVSRFLSAENKNRLSFMAEKLTFNFPNGSIGLRNINIAEEFGLIGIMGASGSGKTTLLNVLSGIESPTFGSACLNGLDIHRDADQTKSMIGYISQDDFLIEDLTVYENLFFNSKFCFNNLKEDEIKNLVEKTLTNFGLYDIKNIKVGTPLNKKISGGQRKRLNIALEFIREPSVLFVDEPTSGLSSRDSENIMDLLKELSLQMKLIFVVIHQPSSDIFKMFDKLFILDTGGYPIYYGNPIEAVMYFKQVAKQINSDIGECYRCGNVNPEILFSIIESKEVDEFGHFTRQRIKSPSEWNELYLRNHKNKEIEEVTTIPSRSFQIPNRLKQIGIFLRRDVLTKLSNLQYILINLLEAPLMALFLTVILKYQSDSKSYYIFRENENIPPYIFMSIVIALFVGLSVSAEEIYRDRKILRRERFLNLSRSSYLISKITILFFLSALQIIIYVLVGNSILGIKGMTVQYWFVLFSVSCFANVLGLNISSSFNSAVTIYILIPLLIIPQMALGGAMFNFDKINKTFGGSRGNAPFIADVMASRWAYEALAVTQFKNNKYEKILFDIEQIKSQANFMQAYYIPELNKIIDESASLVGKYENGSEKMLAGNLYLLNTAFNSEENLFKDLKKMNPNQFTAGKFDEKAANEAHEFLNRVGEKYISVFNAASKKKENVILAIENQMSDKNGFINIYNEYYNDFLAEIVKKTTAENKIIRVKNKLIQNFEPIYLNPSEVNSISLRAHFFAPVKYIFGIQTDTLFFNLIIIWMMSFGLYFALYYDLLRRLIETGDKKAGSTKY